MPFTPEQLRVIERLQLANERAIEQLRRIDAEFQDCDRILKAEARSCEEIFARFDAGWCGNAAPGAYRHYRKGLSTHPSAAVVWMDEEAESSMREAAYDLDRLRDSVERVRARTRESLESIVPLNSCIVAFEGMATLYKELEEVLQRDWSADEDRLRRQYAPTTATVGRLEPRVLMMPPHRQLKFHHAFYHQSYLHIREKPRHACVLLTKINQLLHFARPAVGPVPSVVIHNQNSQQDASTSIGNGNQITGVNAIGDGASAGADEEKV